MNNTRELILAIIIVIAIGAITIMAEELYTKMDMLYRALSLAEACAEKLAATTPQ